MTYTKPGNRGRILVFHRFDGVWKSAAYDGFDRMLHSYAIKRDGMGWMLVVDGVDTQHFSTLKLAKESATDIERSAQRKARGA